MTLLLGCDREFVKECMGEKGNMTEEQENNVKVKKLIPIFDFSQRISLLIHNSNTTSNRRQQNNRTYGWELPVCVHQCHELKMSMSMPLQALPFWIESSFRTRPACSFTKSTRYGVRYSNNLTP